MIVERFESPRWLSNTWLVAEGAGGAALLVDAGAPPGPVLARIAELRLAPELLLLTHHHHDHVAQRALYRDRLGLPALGHAAERELFGGLERELAHEELLRCGALRVRVLHIPGHTAGQLAFLVNDTQLFTGDTLFRRSVGGTRAPGHASFEELRRSILGTLMSLPRSTLVHPGHAASTTLGEEWDENPFVRLWRGLDAPGSEPCAALGEPATLLLRARDYDGGTKCQVRFDAGAELAIVPGSRVLPR